MNTPSREDPWNVHYKNDGTSLNWSFKENKSIKSKTKYEKGKWTAQENTEFGIGKDRTNLTVILLHKKASKLGQEMKRKKFTVKKKIPLEEEIVQNV